MDIKYKQKFRNADSILVNDMDVLKFNDNAKYISMHILYFLENYEYTLQTHRDDFVAKFQMNALIDSIGDAHLFCGDQIDHDAERKFMRMFDFMKITSKDILDLVCNADVFSTEFKVWMLRHSIVETEKFEL